MKYANFFDVLGICENNLAADACMELKGGIKYKDMTGWGC